jgi:hypothetical protein
LINHIHSFHLKELKEENEKLKKEIEDFKRLKQVLPHMMNDLELCNLIMWGYYHALDGMEFTAEEELGYIKEVCNAHCSHRDPMEVVKRIFDENHDEEAEDDEARST